MMAKTVDLDKPVDAWLYESLCHQGVCALGGGMFLVRLRLECGDRKVLPDVRDVESWLFETLKLPATAESLALESAARWRMTAEVTASADDHGKIIARKVSL